MIHRVGGTDERKSEALCDVVASAAGTTNEAAVIIVAEVFESSINGLVAVEESRTISRRLSTVSTFVKCIDT